VNGEIGDEKIPVGNDCNAVESISFRSKCLMFKGRTGFVFLFLPVQQVKLLMKEIPNNHLGSIKKPFALNHGLFFHINW